LKICKGLLGFALREFIDQQVQANEILVSLRTALWGAVDKSTLEGPEEEADFEALARRVFALVAPVADDFRRAIFVSRTERCTVCGRMAGYIEDLIDEYVTSTGWYECHAGSEAETVILPTAVQERRYLLENLETLRRFESVLHQVLRRSRGGLPYYINREGIREELVVITSYLEGLRAHGYTESHRHIRSLVLSCFERLADGLNTYVRSGAGLLRKIS